MTVQSWTFLFVACTFGLYLFVAWRARVRDTGGFYVAGRGVPAIVPTTRNFTLSTWYPHLC